MRRLHGIFFYQFPGFLFANDGFKLLAPQTELAYELGFLPGFLAYIKLRSVVMFSHLL